MSRFRVALDRVDAASHPYVLLAVAVIRRALQDLTLSGVRNAPILRADAYRFLTENLWKPKSLWGNILSGVIMKKDIKDYIDGCCKIDSSGNVIPLRKK